MRSAVILGLGLIVGGSCGGVSPDVTGPTVSPIGEAGAGADGAAGHAGSGGPDSDGSDGGGAMMVDGDDAGAMKPECGSPSDCHDPGKPLCNASGACVACGQLAATACKTANPALPVCAASGACVECGSPSDCHDPGKPLCNASGACVACGQLAATACKTANPALPVCAASGACVECRSSDDCGVATKPICDTTAHTCGSCTSDAQCASKLGANPGVCMGDGHCAGTTEAIFVQNTPGTCSEAGSGTAATPLCSLQPVLAQLSASRHLVVVRGTVSGANWTYAGQGGGTVYLVGQQAAFVAALGAIPAFAMQSGVASVRDMKLTSAASTGITATGGELVLDGVTVDSCQGGILLDGAAFDIRNTTVTNNRAGTSGAITWGGILVNNPPAAGPTRLQLVTVQNNLAPGISCSQSISAMANGVLVSGNGTTDVNTTCGFTSCPAAGPTCGAQ